MFPIHLELLPCIYTVIVVVRLCKYGVFSLDAYRLAYCWASELLINLHVTVIIPRSVIMYSLP